MSRSAPGVSWTAWANEATDSGCAPPAGMFCPLDAASFTAWICWYKATSWPANPGAATSLAPSEGGRVVAAAPPPATPGLAELEGAVSDGSVLAGVVGDVPPLNVRVGVFAGFGANAIFVRSSGLTSIFLMAALTARCSEEPPPAAWPFPTTIQPPTTSAAAVKSTMNVRALLRERPSGARIGPWSLANSLMTVPSRRGSRAEESLGAVVEHAAIGCDEDVAVASRVGRHANDGLTER